MPEASTESDWRSYALCCGCGTEYPQCEPPSTCPICIDTRQTVGPKGQQWTSVRKLNEEGYTTVHEELDPGIFEINTKPATVFYRAILMQTGEGNILWDTVPYLGNDTKQHIEALGGLKAIAVSHPHFLSNVVEWAEAFDVPIYMHGSDEEWLQHKSQKFRLWKGETCQLLSGCTLIRIGGHFPSSSVLHSKDHADGNGLLLVGDSLKLTYDKQWVSFMYSIPTLVPLPAWVVKRIRDTLASWEFERVIGMLKGRDVPCNAKAIVIRSAERYIAVLEGTAGLRYY